MYTYNGIPVHTNSGQLAGYIKKDAWADDWATFDAEGVYFISPVSKKEDAIQAVLERYLQYKREEK